MTKPSLREDRFKELTDVEHVRKRTSIYLGSMDQETFYAPVFGDAFKLENITFIPALMKAISEAVDNCVDELTTRSQRVKQISIDVDEKTQTITISDNGGGIPLDKRPNGKYRPEVALTTFVFSAHVKAVPFGKTRLRSGSLPAVTSGVAEPCS